MSIGRLIEFFSIFIMSLAIFGGWFGRWGVIFVWGYADHGMVALLSTAVCCACVYLLARLNQNGSGSIILNSVLVSVAAVLGDMVFGKNWQYYPVVLSFICANVIFVIGLVYYLSRRNLVSGRDRVSKFKYGYLLLSIFIGLFLKFMFSHDSVIYRMLEGVYWLISVDSIKLIFVLWFFVAPLLLVVSYLGSRHLR